MKYKCINQYDSLDCASACIASVLWHYGKKVSLRTIQNHVNPKVEGASIKDIVEISEKMGLNANALKKETSFNELEIKLPCIAHVFLDDGMGHYIVIYKIEKENLIICDPSVGIIKVKKKDFFDSIYTEESPYIWSGIFVFLSPGDTFTKQNEKTIQRDSLLKLVLDEKKNSVQVILLSLISMILMLLNANYFKLLLDVIIPNSFFYSLILITFFFVILNIIGAFVNKLRIERSLVISKNINMKLSLEYYYHVLKMPMFFHDIRKSGELVSRFQDAGNVQDILVTSILILPVDIVLIIIVSILLAVKSLSMLGLVLGMCMAYVLVVLLYKRKYSVHNAKQMIEQAKVTNHLVDSLEGIETIKLYCQEENQYMEGRMIFNKWQTDIVKIGNIENNQAALKAIVSGVGEIIIICVGVLEVLHGRITVGELITYNILISYILSPIKDIINIQPKFHAAKVAMERIMTIMQSEIEVEEGEKPEKLLQIEMKNIQFAFEKGRTILNNINIKVNKGEKIAIVGDSGSGKTTLAKLFVKLYEPQIGEIRFNSTEISQINSTYLRKNIVYVSQEDFVFSASIKENLTLGDKQISVERMLDVAKLMGVDEFVQNMPRGYDSVLEERGANLSKGQKQKIALARALLREPQLLIIDEATSNMDTVSEKKVMNVLKMQRELTLIIITHRFENIIDSDNIYVMNKGQIIANGSHKKLLLDCFIYKELCDGGQKV